MALAIDRANDKLAGHDSFGIVEDNRLSAKRAGGVAAQLPAADDIEILENGIFVKYDEANGEVNFTGEGPWMMVFNEEKLYDPRKQMHRDYAMQKADALDGIITPRCLRLYAGDTYTTNTVKADSYEVGDKLVPGATGELEKSTDATTGLILQVVKTYTLPDGQPAVKLMVISE